MSTSRYTHPFYNPTISYEENYEQGPFGSFADADVSVERSGTKPNHQFCGHPVYLPFGIPAGPLINAKFVEAAFRHGYDIATYKTVRSRSTPCHPHPNVLPIDVDDDLQTGRSEPVITKDQYDSPLSITNSFGVPSKNPDIWQPDMENAVQSASEGQVMIGSFQGTKPESGSVEEFVKDYVATAGLVKETAAPILEANLSCPNEGTGHLVCFDVARVESIVYAIKQEIGDTPLIIKIAYFVEDSALEQLITTIGKMVAGISAINTIPASVVDRQGKQALPGEGRLISGVCGAAIQWAGLEMTERLVKLRAQHDLDFEVIGVGGVTEPEDYHRYRDAGADAVQSATGAMWRPSLAQEILSAEK
ncbi:MAG: hypothetical protein WDZ94_01330 [Patescibacteria group bacterium]